MENTTMRIEQVRPTAAELDELFPTARLLTLVREHDDNATAGDPAPMCAGAEDEKGQPICDGDDVQPVRATVELVPGQWFQFETAWCADCRTAAVVQGYVVAEIIGDVAEVSHA